MRRIVYDSLFCVAVLLLAALAGEVAASTTAKVALSVTANIATTCTIRIDHDFSPANSSNPLNGRNPVDVQCATGVTSFVTVGRGNDGQTLVATVEF